MKRLAEPRLAIIGCGAVVGYHLAPALRRIGWIPDVLVDTSPDRRELVATKFGRRDRMRLGNDWRTFADDFDVAIVAVPPGLHGPIGTGLLEAGKHLFMEKPLAATAAAGRLMVETAARRNVVLSVGLLRRYLRIARWMKGLIVSGLLGTIRRAEIREGFVFNWDIASVDTIQAKSSAGGVLMDTGAHTIDLLAWWLGPINVITYEDDNRGGVESDCRMTFQLCDGGKGQLELSRVRDLCNTITLEGTRGFVEAHLYKNEIVSGSESVLRFMQDGIGYRMMSPQPFPDLFDAELKDFRASAAGSGYAGVSGSEALQSIELIERCYAVRTERKAPWAPSASGSLGPSKSARSFPHGCKVLVTGATGFIGGRLVEKLVQDYGAQVRCPVRNLGHATRVARLPVDIRKVDLSNSSEVAAVVDGVDYVFHCAYDVQSFRQNLDGIDNLLRSSTEYNVRRLIHVSTFSVYEPFSDGPLCESTRDGDSQWAYVRTKLELERRIFSQSRQGGVPATIIQPTIVYGPFGKPWTNGPSEMLIHGEVILPDQGEGLCNAVYVDDVVDGMILAAISPAAPGERFLISGPQPVTWSSFFDEFARALSVRGPTFWPKERIAASNHGFMHDVRLVLANPKSIIQIIVRWPAARAMLQSGLEAMPARLRGLIMSYYAGSSARRLDQTFLPNPQLLSLYGSKAHVQLDKARHLLGYRPRFSFQQGMQLTRPYLEWMYGDVLREATRRRRTQSGHKMQPAAGLVRAE